MKRSAASPLKLCLFALAIFCGSQPASAHSPESVLISTSQGVIRLKLYPAQAPQTVAHFVSLAQKGFYNGLSFFRAVPELLIQGGDPSGTGLGGLAYVMPDEISQTLHANRPGMVALANHGPGTSGSQFFITLRETPWLEGKYNFFAEVTSGLEVAKKIEAGDKIIAIRTEPAAKKTSARTRH